MNYAWLQPTLERIADLLKLPDIHNSFGCAKVDPDTALNVLDFLSDHMAPMDPTPRIIPTPIGGLHLEWSGILSSCWADFNPDAVYTASYGPKEVYGSIEAAALIESALSTFGTEQIPPKVSA